MSAFVVVATKPDQPIAQLSSVHVSEVLSALSFALDLSTGQPMGHSVRSCVIGMRLAKEIGIPQQAQADLYHALLMKDAGASSSASSLLQRLGADGIRARRELNAADWSQRSWESLQYALSHTRVGFLERFRTRIETTPQQKELERELVKIRGDRGAMLARKMGLSDATASAIRSLDEHWNGEGSPESLHGEEIPLLARILSLAQALDVLYTAIGGRVALDTARQRNGTWFDPELIRAADSLSKRGALWADMESANWSVVEMEPREEPLPAGQATLDRICEAFGEIIDSKTPFSYRHSTGVAGTAVFIARMLDMGESDITVLRRAALLHDIGKLGISNTLLDKPGRLTNEEWAELRKHAYYSYAILKRVPGFGDLAEIASSHHEKLDGSGYFRGLKGEQLSLPTRILVIADIYDALSTTRPYRDALQPEMVFEIMRSEAPHALDATCLEALMRSADPTTSNTVDLAQLSASVQHN